MQEPIDISTMTSTTELKILLADEFTTRENAAAVHQQANANIQAIQRRIAQVEQEAMSATHDGERTINEEGKK